MKRDKIFPLFQVSVMALSQGSAARFVIYLCYSHLANEGLLLKCFSPAPCPLAFL